MGADAAGNLATSLFVRRSSCAVASYVVCAHARRAFFASARRGARYDAGQRVAVGGALLDVVEMKMIEVRVVHARAPVSQTDEQVEVLEASPRLASPCLPDVECGRQNRL